MTTNSSQFGGKWTKEKLDILEKYLDSYTTALKNQKFDLVYIDAFAGDGFINTVSDAESGTKEFLEGSVLRALNIEDKPFDQLVFVEQNPDRIERLEKLVEEYSIHRVVEIKQADANDFLSTCGKFLKGKRGVLFLDPFSTEVSWQTIEKIAEYESLDTWLLFPVSAISRMLPKERRPDEISKNLVECLNKVYGDESWRELYTENPQQTLFGEPGYERKPGVDGLVRIYKEKLRSLLGQRFLENHRDLKNSRNSTLFAFMFFVGNPKGIGPAVRIAKHILDEI